MNEYNQMAAVLLGSALRKIFPHIAYLGSGVNEEGFYALFRDEAPFQEGFFPMLENAMKEFGKQKLQKREMLAANAAELFSHENEEILAETLHGARGTIDVVQVDEYLDFASGSLQYSPHFTLLGFQQNRREVRVFGEAFPTQKELKNFLKLYRKYPQKNHAYIAKELDLYEGEFWHPRGMKLLQILKEKWRSVLTSSGFEEVGAANAKEYFAVSGRKKFCTFNGFEDHIFSFEKEDLISCLQIIEKWIKIFDFKVRWVLQPSRQKKLARTLKEQKIDYVERESEEGRTPRVELLIADGLGRYWCGPTLECEKEGYRFSLFGKLARFVALILEKTEGDLPFWMCPEQVRLLPLESADEEIAIQVLEQSRIRFQVDREKSPLKEKMHRALRAKVPYVMVFGKQEEKAEKMKIRACGSSHDQTLTIEQMKNFLAERQVESQ